MQGLETEQEFKRSAVTESVVPSKTHAEETEGVDLFDPKSEQPNTYKMFCLFLKLAIPSILTNLLAFVTVVTNGVLAGQMEDPVNLAVVGLSGTCCGVLVQSIMIGLNSAQETLTSQAFGHGELKLCGQYLNRGHFILLVFFMPLAVVPAIFAEEIFNAIG